MSAMGQYYLELQEKHMNNQCESNCMFCKRLEEGELEYAPL